MHVYADHRVPVQHRAVVVLHVRDGVVSRAQAYGRAGARPNRNAPDRGRRVPGDPGQDDVAQRERRVPRVRGQGARVRRMFPGPGRWRFRSVHRVRVRRHHTADKRVPLVPYPSGRPRPHRHHVLRAHVRAKPMHVFNGNPLCGALFQAVPAVLSDQRGRVRAQVDDGLRKPVPVRAAAVGQRTRRRRPSPQDDVRDASHSQQRRAAPDEASVRPGRSR